MTSLPYPPAAELATRSDIEALEERIDDVDSKMRSGLGDIRQMAEHHRSYFVATIGVMTALTGIFSLIVGLIT